MQYPFSLIAGVVTGVNFTCAVPDVDTASPVVNLAAASTFTSRVRSTWARLLKAFRTAKSSSNVFTLTFPSLNAASMATPFTFTLLKAMEAIFALLLDNEAITTESTLRPSASSAYLAYTSSITMAASVPAA